MLLGHSGVNLNDAPNKVDWSSDPQSPQMLLQLSGIDCKSLQPRPIFIDYETHKCENLIIFGIIIMAVIKTGHSQYE